MRNRSHRIQQRQITALSDVAGELIDMELVENIDIEVRHHALTPLFKLFLINGADIFFGFYPIQRKRISIDGAAHDVFDLGGKDTDLFRYEIGDTDGAGAPFVKAAVEWFTTVWSELSWAAENE